MSARSRIVYLFAAMLLFTSIGRAENAKLEQRVYQVADLVIPLGDTPKSEKAAAPALRTTGWAASRKAVTCEDRLIKLITTTISPRSWSQRGGRGTIDYFPLTMSLVINQTPAIQDKIAELLAAQRRIQNMEVSVEVKFAEVTEELFQKLKERGIFGDPDKKAHGQENVAFLKHAQMLRFMDAIQDDVDTNVMQAPKLTMFNGQAVAFHCPDYQTFVTGLEIVHCGDHIEYRPKRETIPLGVQLDVRSVVSADRHSVRVHLNTSLSTLASFQRPQFPITTPDPSKENGPDGKPQMVTHYIDQPQVIKLGMKRTLVIPDQSTAVLTGLTRKYEVRNEYGPPILSKLPIVRNWFCSVAYGCQTHHLLVLVTPRIHVNQEKEEKKPRTLPRLNEP